MKTKIKIYGDAFFSGGMYRLPDENGEDTEYYMDDEWLEAHAFDDEGKEYLILWDLLPDWDGLSSENACNWNVPTAVVLYGPDGKNYEVSAKVIIEE